MAVLQSNYPTDYQAGLPGMVANGETSNRISRTVRDAALPFGAPVFDHADPHCCTPTAGGAFLGVAMKDISAPLPATLGGTAIDAYPVDYTAGVMDYGVIWVRVTNAVTADSPATLAVGGGFGAGGTAIPGATFLDAADANGLSRLKLRNQR